MIFDYLPNILNFFDIIMALCFDDTLPYVFIIVRSAATE